MCRLPMHMCSIVDVLCIAIVVFSLGPCHHGGLSPVWVIFATRTAICSEHGWGVPHPDFAVAVTCYLKASALDHLDSRNNLGVLCQLGQGMVPQGDKALEYVPITLSRLLPVPLRGGGGIGTVISTPKERIQPRCFKSVCLCVCVCVCVLSLGTSR
jgi:hypothetical protein